MANRNYIAEGSSSTVATSYAEDYIAATTYATTLHNVSSAGTAAILSTPAFPDRVTTNNALLVAGAVNFMTFWPFGNDFTINTNSTQDNNAVSTYLTLFANYRQAGWRVMIISPSPRGDVWDGTAGAGSAAKYNTLCPSLIAQLQGLIGTTVDGVIDWWNDPNYGYSQRNDTNKYADGVHISTAGKQYLATLFQPTLDTFGGYKRFIATW
jgi:lysophospholipase L1-like esterase